MHALSPILHEMSDYKDFLTALYTASHAATAKSQADALTPIWQALDASDKKQDKLTAPTLHQMFCDIAQYLHVVQLQRPLIAPYSQMLSAQLKTVMRKSMPDDMAQSTDIATYGAFGTATLLPNRKYKFTFLRARQNHDTLTVIPVIMIDGDILNATLNNDGHDLLQTLQSLSDISNHDYIHAATAPLINAYFGDNALHLPKTAYMRALNRTDMQQNPLRTLYPNNETSWGTSKQTPLALDAYDIHSPLEGHALRAHKALFENYLDTHPTAQLVDTYFDRLTTLMHKMDNNAAEIGQYYTVLLYHRMLHMLPHSHPIMQHIEQRGAALPIPHIDWQIAYATLTNPQNAKTETRKNQLKSLPMRLRKHAKLNGNGDIEDQPIQKIIRMTAHANGMQYWIPLHYDQHKNANRALPDLHRVFKTTHADLNAVRNTLKAA